MATINILLSEQMKVWVETQITAGRYTNADDYICDLIRKDQERTRKIASMQKLVDKGLDSGPAESKSVDEIFEKARRKASCATD